MALAPLLGDATRAVRSLYLSTTGTLHGADNRPVLLVCPSPVDGALCADMATRLTSVVIDAADPSALGHFWAEVLGWSVTWEEPDEVAVEAADHESPALVFLPVPETKTGKNRVHLDLATTSREHEAAELDRLAGLGATPVDIDQGDVPWTVLADPEGNEFCLLDPRDRYRDTGMIAAIVVDAHDPGILARFWSAAASWILTDEFQDSFSLRSQTSEGPYLEFLPTNDRKRVKNRVHLDVAPFPGGDQEAEVERLQALGAVPVDVGQGDVTWVVLADPEGNEFCVLSPR